MQEKKEDGIRYFKEEEKKYMYVYKPCVGYYSIKIKI